MDEEILKRNTDCVYFLASPLTCKKGAECEYRHSESARLNPRDCWYWLSGSCRNPTCAFRHPPLEGRSETTLEPASLPNPASVPVTKTNVPCYYYFNGFCNKGDSCSFMHGPNGVAPAWQTPKTASTVSSLHVENKPVARSDKVSASVEPLVKPSETRMREMENVHVQSKVVLQPPDLQQNPLLQPSIPECEEAVIKSEALLPAEDFILCGDQSSEDQVADHIEPEERWESSPGFDVLVDDGSENLGYEDDPEYFIAQETEAGGLHDHSLQYDYEAPVGYDPLEYPDSGILYEQRMYDSYEHLENDHISDYIQRVPKRSRDTLLDPTAFQKGKLLSREAELSDRKGLDLRDHLRKRRRITGHPKRHGVSHQNGRRLAHRRLAPETGNNVVIGAHGEDETRGNEKYRRDSLRHSQLRHSGARLHEREKRRQARAPSVFSEVARGVKGSSPTEESIAFSGPKTLAQIKEEKKRAKENEDNSKGTSYRPRTASQHFEGPKPLSEILKHKKRLGSMSDDSTSSKLNHVHFDEDKREFLGEDDDDEDEYGLEKKLAGLLG